jgi:hypothetical protein
VATSSDAIDALVRSGVQLDDLAVSALDCGAFGVVLVDAIGLADEQQAVLTADVLRDVRDAFEHDCVFRPGSNEPKLIRDALQRIEERSAAAAA